MRPRLRTPLGPRVVGRSVVERVGLAGSVEEEKMAVVWVEALLEEMEEILEAKVEIREGAMEETRAVREGAAGWRVMVEAALAPEDLVAGWVGTAKAVTRVVAMGAVSVEVT